MAEQSLQPSDTSNAVRVVTLEGLEGVGRVTTRRLLTQFPVLEVVAKFPREQALNRLKGIPNAGKLVDRLRSDEGLTVEMAEAKNQVEAWSKRNIRVCTFLDSDWPGRLDDLPNPHRPNALFEYGNVGALAVPTVALVAGAALGEGPFEAAQTLVAFLAERGIRVIVGMETGFDVVAIKRGLAGELPPQIVAGSGLARVEPKMRPHASRLVKSGGLMVSSFPMDHGPFDHDAREAALVKAALAKAAVFVDLRPGGFEWDAFQWALESGSSVFAIGGEQIPSRVHPIRGEVDLEWVAAAVERVHS